MSYKTFADFSDSIRAYNSTSILEIGTQQCWKIWVTQSSDPQTWVINNAFRNYAIRIILLASAGNPHRRKNISIQEFYDCINNYFSWDGHTIASPDILDNESEILLESIRKWEGDNPRKLRNLLLKLSDIFDLAFIRQHMAGLFVQRQLTFQNASFGYPLSRIQRTIKFIEILDKNSNQTLSNKILQTTGLTQAVYFKQFLGCLALFNLDPEIKGFIDFSQLPIINEELQEYGISRENLRLFVNQNSALFCSDSRTSFRNRVKGKMDGIPEVYRLFFHNLFLETPFIEVSQGKFYLPDPFSFTESCWNHIESVIFQEISPNKKGEILSKSLEDYLENILLPCICPHVFKRITEVEKPVDKEDKRADFLICLPNAYIIIECKNSIMSLDTSTYFHPNGVAELWYRIHQASEQIATTVRALSLNDKPVIPIIITFYDSITSSQIFEEMAKESNYCSILGLNIPPLVRSLHEFEHWISNRSLDNWAELILQKHNNTSIVKHDDQGHNYKHLEDVSII